MDKKRILLIVLFILAVFLITYGLYAVFWKKPTAPPTGLINAPAVNAPAGVLPTAGIGAPAPVAPALPTVTALPKASLIARGGLTATPALTTTAALNPSLAGDGKNVNFYDQSVGKFYRLTPDGQMSPLSSQTFYNVKNITWAPAGDKAILEYPDNSKILYNFNTQKQATLPKHWENFSFSGQGDQIAAKSIGVSPENRWLVTADPDGANVKLIEPLGDNADKVQVNWSPAGSVVAFTATGDALGFGRRQIIPLGLNNENYKPLIVEGMNFEPKWSKTGDKLIYSTYSPDTDYNPTIWFTSAQGEQMGSGRRKLNLNTWADKCVFANNDVVYCAVPNELQRGAGLVPEVAAGTPDTLYKVDLKSNLKSVVAVPESNYDMKNLVVSADQSILYFTDQTTGHLHKIQLK